MSLETSFKSHVIKSHLNQTLLGFIFIFGGDLTKIKHNSLHYMPTCVCVCVCVCTYKGRGRRGAVFVAYLYTSVYNIRKGTQKRQVVNLNKTFENSRIEQLKTIPLMLCYDVGMRIITPQAIQKWVGRSRQVGK